MGTYGPLGDNKQARRYAENHMAWKRTHPQSRSICGGGTHPGDRGGLPLSFPATISRNELDSTPTSGWMWPQLICRSCLEKR